MKLIIAGSRTITQYGFVEASIAFLGIEEQITQIVSGGADGIDKLGERWADEHNKPTTGEDFYVTPEEWQKLGKAAGPKRNDRMAQYADACLLIWDGESKGSKSMKEKAELHGITLYQVIIKKV